MKKILYCFLLGFSMVLTTVKLCGFMHWAWWEVWAPVWVPAVFEIVVAIVAVIIAYRHYKKNPPLPAPKSKWQQKLEEMQAQREKR